MAVLFLHIGTQKTGTTSIQYVLKHNGSALKKHGIAYPHQKGYPGNKNANFMISSKVDEQGRKQFYNDLFSKARGCEKMVMSEEDIYKDATASCRVIKEAVSFAKTKGYDTKIIIYLRRQDEYVYSFWSEAIKQGNVCTSFEDFYIRDTWNKRLDYLKTLDQLEEIVGKGNVIVKAYGKKFGSDLVKEFFDILGVSDISGFDVSEGINKNDSLSGIYLEAKRRMNKYSNGRNKLVEQAFFSLIEEDKDNLDKKVKFISGKQRKDICEKYREDNRKIAEKYLGLPAGTDLFDMPKEEGDEVPSYSDEEIMEILIRVNQKMGEQNLKLEESLKLRNLPKVAFKKLFMHIKG